MRKVRLNVQGRVQGVGFRYTTKILADQLGVTGRIWNEADGSVSIEALATEDVIKQFIRKLKDSPTPAGRVTYIDITDDPLIEETDRFSVVYR